MLFNIVLFDKKIFFVYGLSGVGKTTLLQNLIEDKEVLYINFGDLMFEVAKSEGKVENRDELGKKLSVDDYKRIYHKAIDWLEELVFNSEKRKVVIDTHLILKLDFGFFVGIQKVLIQKITPDCLIFIKADAKEILERRLKDKTRNRKIEDEKEIEREIEIAEVLSLTIAFETGAILKEINNKTGKINEARKKLEEIIKNY